MFIARWRSLSIVSVVFLVNIVQYKIIATGTCRWRVFGSRYDWTGAAISALWLPLDLCFIARCWSASNSKCVHQLLRWKKLKVPMKQPKREGYRSMMGLRPKYRRLIGFMTTSPLNHGVVTADKCGRFLRISRCCHMSCRTRPMQAIQSGSTQPTRSKSADWLTEKWLQHQKTPYHP